MIAIVTFITSCQEERIHEEPQQPTFAVNNNSEELSQRVTMYRKKTSAHKAPSVTRSMMPDVPTAPEYDLIMDGGYQSWAAEAKNYLLPEGTSLTTDVQFKENVYYIAGELTITNYWGKGTLIVLPGGKVNYPSQKAIHELNILSYGDFNITGTDRFNINLGATFMTSGDLCYPEIWVGGTLYVGDGLSATVVEVREYAVCQVGCGVYADDYLIIHNYAELTVGSHLVSPKVEMNSASLLQVNAGGLIETEALYMKNPCTVTVEGGDMEYAVLSADKIEIHQSNVKDMFTGWLDIHYQEIS